VQVTAFTGRQPVGSGGARVTADKAVLHQLGFDRGDRAENARVVGRQKPDLRDQQQRGVEIASAVVLDEGVALAVEAPLKDLRGDPAA